MKPVSLIVPWLIVICSLLLSACSNEEQSLVDIDNRPTVPTSAVNSFTVNGDAYVNASFRGYSADSLSSATVQNGVTTIEFSGLTPSSEEFAIAIVLQDTLEGEYHYDDLQRAAISMTITSRTGGDRSFIIADGVVVLDAVNRMAGKVSGSFSGTMQPLEPLVRPISISAGTFSIRRPVL
jgi:hypothetical protein